MGPNDPFFGPFLKVERAEHHIHQLETIFGDYIRDNVKRLRPKGKNRSLKAPNLRTFPKHTPTILGDAIHNLHASLDHAYHVVCEANGVPFSHYRRFPFGKDRQSLEGSINGHKKEGIAPSDKVIAAILDEIQPYGGGKLGLYGLHELDITDKHIVLLPTSSRMAIERLDVVDSAGAKTGTRIEGITLVAHDAQKGGEFIEFKGGYGAVLHGDPKKTFAITFQQGQPFEGQSILETMKSLRAATLEGLDLLRRAVV